MENEKRLIDANALELEPDFRNVMNGVRFGGRGGGRTAAMVQVALKHMIDNAPTVDAVPVVRCKDCRRRGKRGQCPLVHLVIAPDGLKDIIDYSDDSGFCYYGEKEKDSNDA